MLGLSKPTVLWRQDSCFVWIETLFTGQVLAKVCFQPFLDEGAWCHLFPFEAVAWRKEVHQIQLQVKAFTGRCSNKITLLIKVEFSYNRALKEDRMMAVEEDKSRPLWLLSNKAERMSKLVTRVSIAHCLWGKSSLCGHLQDPIQSQMPLLTHTRNYSPSKQHPWPIGTTPRASVPHAIPFGRGHWCVDTHHHQHIRSRGN